MDFKNSQARQGRAFRHLWQMKKFVYFLGVFNVPYVHSKFVQQEAVGIYYIPWPAKKNCCPKFLHKFVFQTQPKTVQPAQPTSQSCQKKKTSNKHMVSLY